MCLSFSLYQGENKKPIPEPMVNYIVPTTFDDVIEITPVCVFK